MTDRYPEVGIANVFQVPAQIRWIDQLLLGYYSVMSLCKSLAQQVARYLVRATLLELGRASNRETVAG